MQSHLDDGYYVVSYSSLISVCIRAYTVAPECPLRSLELILSICSFFLSCSFSLSFFLSFTLPSRPVQRERKLTMTQLAHYVARQARLFEPVTSK